MKRKGLSGIATIAVIVFMMQFVFLPFSAYAVPGEAQSSNFDEVLGELFGGDISSIRESQLMSKIERDYSALKGDSNSEEIGNILDKYAEFRNASLTSADKSSSVFSGDILGDEKSRSKLIAQGMQNIQAEILSAKTIFKINNFQKNNGDYILDVYEWVFYIYSEKGFSDLSGYGVNHEIKIGKSGNIISDTYFEDNFALIKSSSYDGDPYSQEEIPEGGDVQQPGKFAAAASSANEVKYDPHKAVAYADKYALSYNKSYRNFNNVGGDCANFVSQCMQAGGLMQDSEWYYNDSDRTNGGSVLSSGPWIHATLQKRYLEKLYPVIAFPDDGDVFTGNPVYYSNNNGSTYAHTAICTGRNNAGTPVVNAHNNDRYRVNWKLGTWSKHSTVLLSSDIDYTPISKVSFTAKSGAENLIKISWSAVAEASSYSVSIWQTNLASGTKYIYDTDLTSTSKEYLLPNGIYQVLIEADGENVYEKSELTQLTVSSKNPPLTVLKNEIFLAINKNAPENVVMNPVYQDYLGTEITLESSDSNIAKITSDGNILGVDSGNAKITASAGGFSVSFDVYVRLSADDVSIIRLSGEDRYETANAISDNGWEEVKTVVLANSQKHADALAGVPLAYELDAPILLTGAGRLEPSTRDQLKKLNPEKIILLGGTSAIYEGIENFLTSQDYNVERISGEDRYETALKIAERLALEKGIQAPEKGIMVTGMLFADALSISPYAAVKGYPILYSNPKETISDSTKSYLQKVDEVLVIGGENAVTPNNVLELEHDNIVRMFGETRYLTSAKIANEFESEFGKDVSLATGLNFPDALAGSVLSAKRKIPMLLIDKTVGAIPEICTYVQDKKCENIYVYGGETAVPTSSLKNLIV